MKNGEGVSRERIGGREWLLKAAVADALKERVIRWLDVLKGRPEFEVVRDNAGRTVAMVDGGKELGRVVVKCFRLLGLRRRLGYRFLANRAKREWRATRYLEARGILVAEALAVGWRHRGFMAEDCWFVSRRLEGFVSVSELMGKGFRQPGWSAEVRGEVMREAGRTIRRLHELRFRHRDVHPGNVLVRRDGGLEVGVVDLDCAKFGRRISARRRAKDLADMGSKLRRRGEAGDLPAFVEGYMEGGSPAVLRRLIEKAVAKKVAERMRGRGRRASAGERRKSAGEGAG